MKTDKIVEILKEVTKEVYVTAVHGFRGSNDYNFKRLNKYVTRIHALYTAEISEEEIQKAVFDYNGLSDKTMLRWPIPENAPLNKAFYDGVQWALSKGVRR